MTCGGSGEEPPEPLATAVGAMRSSSPAHAAPPAFPMLQGVLRQGVLQPQGVLPNSLAPLASGGGGATGLLANGAACLEHTQQTIEEQLLHELHEKRQIEMLQAQLISITGMLRSLEQSNRLQTQQMEANLRRALLGYEQARKMRQQQVTLRAVIDTIRGDIGQLRSVLPEGAGHSSGASLGASSPSQSLALEEEIGEETIANHCELPPVDELFARSGGSSLADVVATADAAASAASSHPANMGAAASSGGALPGPMALHPPPERMAGPGTGHAFTATAAAAAGLAAPARAPASESTESALQALALLSTVASQSSASGPSVAPPSSRMDPPQPPAQPLPAQGHLRPPPKFPPPPSPLGPARVFIDQSLVSHTAAGVGAAWSPPLSSLALANAQLSARTVASLASLSAPPRRAQLPGPPLAPLPPMPSALPPPPRLTPSALHEASAEMVSAAAALAEAERPRTHTTLTSALLNAHDGGMAAAGMAGPGALPMWMGGVQGGAGCLGHNLSGAGCLGQGPISFGQSLWTSGMSGIGCRAAALAAGGSAPLSLPSVEPPRLPPPQLQPQSVALPAAAQAQPPQVVSQSVSLQQQQQPQQPPPPPQPQPQPPQQPQAQAVSQPQPAQQQQASQYSSARSGKRPREEARAREETESTTDDRSAAKPKHHAPSSWRAANAGGSCSCSSLSGRHASTSSNLSGSDGKGGSDGSDGNGNGSDHNGSDGAEQNGNGSDQNGNSSDPERSDGGGSTTSGGDKRSASDAGGRSDGSERHSSRSVSTSATAVPPLAEAANGALAKDSCPKLTEAGDSSTASDSLGVAGGRQSSSSTPSPS